MLLLFLFVLAVVFAIPTWGLSLLAYWLLSGLLNKLAAKPIIVAMYSSYKLGGQRGGLGKEIILPHRSYATVRKAFKILNVTEYEERSYAGGLRTFTGYVQHPMHPAKLLVQIHCQRERGEKPYISVVASDTSAGANEWLANLTGKNAS